MSTPERQQDPGEHGYGAVKQETPTPDDEREETPQERADEKSAEQRRLSEVESEESAQSVGEHVRPTDNVDIPSQDDEELGAQ